jgi:hypothetical protein
MMSDASDFRGELARLVDRLRYREERVKSQFYECMITQILLDGNPLAKLKAVKFYLRDYHVDDEGTKELIQFVLNTSFPAKYFNLDEQQAVVVGYPYFSTAVPDEYRILLQQHPKIVRMVQDGNTITSEWLKTELNVDMYYTRKLQTYIVWVQIGDKYTIEVVNACEMIRVCSNQEWISV